MNSAPLEKSLIVSKSAVLQLCYNRLPQLYFSQQQLNFCSLRATIFCILLSDLGNQPLIAEVLLTLEEDKKVTFM